MKRPSTLLSWRHRQRAGRTCVRRGRGVIPIRAFGIILIATAGLLAGCGKPNAANIELRKQIQDLQSQIAQLQQQRDADAATIRSLESRATTVPVLPHDRVEKLFTVTGLRFGRLTGGVDLDPDLPGDEALKLHVVPVDRAGDELKAAGSFSIDLYDLSLGEDAHLGHWEFSTDEAAKHWFGQALLFEYVFELPWQTPPRNVALLALVTFTDELTGRVITAKRDVTVVPPASNP